MQGFCRLGVTEMKLQNRDVLFWPLRDALFELSARAMSSHRHA
jgi:hypothetical protein